ncbi:hypothetical protein ACIREO_22310 [Streptomyces sp. NPDC102441]|uniref:hypothetical protein n=1 Tax=Streptomyces sp. NPDC102441 TaxID=3366176 RepID=UPI0038127A07
MAILNYKRLSHERDEFPHVQGAGMRGQRRRNSRRKTRRVIKRWEERAWRRETKEDDK